MNNNARLEITEDALIVLGVAISIDQIKTILGIVLLALQIALILYKGIKLVYNRVKNKDIKGAIEGAKDVVEDVKKEIDKHGRE